MSGSSETVDNNEFVMSNKGQDPIVNSPAERWFNWLEQTNIGKWSTVITLLFGIYVRWNVGLNPYSGKLNDIISQIHSIHLNDAN
jgi:hypothetical protein